MIDDQNRWCPDRCPITLLPFFRWIEHPTLGLVPTYGGPYDSYTMAEPDDDELVKGTRRAEIDYVHERFDHDQGGWIEGCERVGLRVVTEELLIDHGVYEE